MKNHKIKSAKTKFRVRESVTLRKVLAPYSARLKAIPLIKFAKEMCLCQIFIFPIKVRNKLDKICFE